MIRARALALMGMVLAGAVVWRVATVSAESSDIAAVPAPSTALGQYTAWQTWKLYCVECHIGPRAPAGLNLQALDLDHLEKNGAVWEKLLRKLRNRDMPPAGLPRPNEATYRSLVNFIETERDRAAQLKPNPGHPTLHRLNRTEYANAVRDLLAIEVDVAEMLPADDTGYGFDNIGDVLQVSPLLMERYLSAAGRISRLAIGDTTMPVAYQTYSVSHGLNQVDRMSENMPLGSRGGTFVRHYFPVDGQYDVSVSLARGKADEFLGMGQDRTLDLTLDGQRLGLFTIPAIKGQQQAVFGTGHDPDSHMKIHLPVKAGPHTLVATFLKDTVVSEDILPQRGRGGNGNDKDYFEGVGAISVVGPYDVQGPGATEARDRIFVCHPGVPAEEQACAEKIIANLAHRAFRRPLAADDLPPLMGLYRRGVSRGGFEAGIKLALQTLLVSPDFIFRTEVDPPDAARGSVHRISDVELASRLSFFLWSSIPDDALLAAAERGQLGDKAVLEAQVRRMLDDPRSHALVKNFVGQWLFLRNIPRIVPDSTAFPNFDDNLRQALEQETELLVESTLREDRSVADLLKTDYTFVNQRLAEHYGMKGIYGNEFRRVALTDPNRQGLLGQASIMTVTSYPDRTAPTIRGKWVLEQLLGTPPPPPPPNVPALKDDSGAKVLTMRERMEQHRASPQCAACHRLMDPIGFALENFDGIGRWRDTAGEDGTGAIDSSGVLPDGTGFNGPSGLRDILLHRRGQFIETFTERLLTYALGRGVEEYDAPVIRKIARDALTDDQRWSSIILGIVNSNPFQMRRVSDGYN
jgi:Protein of unknown function (DUF1592)/Protein of unknown function (DUF1588)/Protein of unknown function (DUF1587)/Protein of unknown function (DUF1585)/Protein of unknown function (DUF1595)